MLRFFSGHLFKPTLCSLLTTNKTLQQLADCWCRNFASLSMSRQGRHCFLLKVKAECGSFQQQVYGARISVPVITQAIASFLWAEDDRGESQPCLVTAHHDVLHILLQIPRTKDSKWLHTETRAPPRHDTSPKLSRNLVITTCASRLKLHTRSHCWLLFKPTLAKTYMSDHLICNSCYITPSS